MKNIVLFITTLLCLAAFADTPPPGTVKAKMFTGDGVTPLTATSGALNVNITNSGGLSVVDQGHAGVESWLMAVTSSALPTNACQESGGHLASIDTKLTSPLAVTGTFWQATQPISAASLPLPSGAATSAKQPDFGIAGIASADVLTVQGIAGMTALKVDGSGVTQPVSGTFWQAVQPVSGTITANAGTDLNTSALALESGGHLASLDTKLPAQGQALAANSMPVVLTAAQLSTLTPLSSVTVSGTVTANAGTGTFLVDGSAHTQPVSGTFWQATQPISAVSLPLPTGAATDSSLSTINTTLGNLTNNSQKSQLVDSSGNAATLKSLGTQVVAGDYGIVTNTVIHGLSTGGGGGYVDVKVNPSGALVADVSNSTGLVLGAGSASIGTVTANAGTGTFTVDASGHTVPVSGTFWQAVQPVSGTVTANIGTSGSLALDATVSGLQVAQNSTTSGQSGPLIQGAVTTAAPAYTTAKTSPLSLTTAGALRIDGSATTQPVSGTVTANAGSGTFLVDGSAHTQPVSGTFWQATQPVSLSTLPALTAGSAIIGKVGIDQTTPGTTNGVQVNAALPAGSNVIGKVSIDQTTPGTTNLVALAANQSVNVAQINGVTPLMGNGVTGTGSQRVTIASDNTAFSVNAIPVASSTASQTTGTVSTVITLTAPANAQGFILQNLQTSTANVRFAMGATATTTVGMQLAPGQDSGYVPAGVNVSLVSESGTQNYNIQWVSK